MTTGDPRAEGTCWDVGWDGHERRQARRGLELTPAARLRWLEETMAEMRALLGRAREPTPMVPSPWAGDDTSGGS